MKSNKLEVGQSIEGIYIGLSNCCTCYSFETKTGIVKVQGMGQIVLNMKMEQVEEGHMTKIKNLGPKVFIFGDSTPVKTDDYEVGVDDENSQKQLTE